MTSNMGSQVIQENFAEAFDGKKLPSEVVERTRREVIDLLKQQLKPEFLNRIDEIVMFEPLTRREIERIVDIQLGIVRRMLAENGIGWSTATRRASGSPRRVTIRSTAHVP